MAPTAGYTATVSISGTSTAMTAEPCTELDAGPPAVYQVTSSSKQVLDPAVAVAVYDNAVLVDADDYSLDYLFGVITFSVSVVGPVTITANFLPRLVIGGCRSATINPTRDELDTNVLGTVEKSFINGKRGATVEMETLDLLSDDLDPGGGSVVLDTINSASTPKLIEVTTAGRIYRGWHLLPSTQLAVPQDGVITSSLSWRTSERLATGRPERVAYSYFTP